jgi:tetratricopeptide (TPR) repeat protein
LLLRAVELEPTLERRYFAARAAWRLADMTAVIVEMEEVAKAAAASGETQLQGRALTALADAILYQRADALGAQRLITQALEVLDGESAEIRFEPLSIASQIAQWLGDQEAFERWAKLALHAAQEAGRKDQEAIVTHALAIAYLHRLDFDEAEPLIDRVAELAAESGSAFSRGNALAVRGSLEVHRCNFVEAEAAFVAARELYSEIGNALREASMTLNIGRAAVAQGELERGEKLLRDSERALKGLGGRGQLCEAQRALAQVLVKLGRLEEAERFALESRETVGPEDRVSGSTTKIALAEVRAAQGRDAEAEELFREALEGLEFFGFRSSERAALENAIDFYRERGRDDEVARYEARRAELSPSSTAPIA